MTTNLLLSQDAALGWLCIPFAALLMCIAILPLIKAEWWEHNQPIIVVILSLCFMVPYAIVYGIPTCAETVLECIVGDYITFIVLLLGLFCVSGNITLEGDLAGSPRINCGVLFFGALLSSCIGTTGASMLLIRPMIKMNSWRKRKTHIMVFFIFLICNMGGCLTPIGDPPLLMGFMRGVPFTWSLSLFIILLFNLIVLLSLFYIMDTHFYRKDIAEGLLPDISRAGTTVRIKGIHNIVFMITIVIAVVLSGVLPSLPAFVNADGSVKGIHIFEEVTLTWPAIIEITIILISALLSFKTTDEGVRKQNHFGWGPIKEVAILFIGIFITMQPALAILKAKGPTLGITEPWQMFWTTGLLSSFLDNTPTYLVFLTTAGTLGFTEGIVTTVGTIPPQILTAISCGAVFMGAGTYIGNAPNFMVKSISDENGIRMPAFFTYILWSVTILGPVFVLDTFLFLIWR